MVMTRSQALSTRALNPEAEKDTWAGPFIEGGDFFKALATARYASRSENSLQRWGEICRKAAQGLHEGTDPDGGNLVPVQTVERIYDRVMRPTELLPYLDPVKIKAREAIWPVVAEDSRVDGSRRGGVRGYWVDEAEQHTATHPSFRNIQLRLRKLVILTYVTEELFQDSGVLEAFLVREASKEIAFQLNDALVNGSGLGKPLGFLNSPSKITAAAVSGQGANTLVAENILDLRSRINPTQRAGMVWLYSASAEDELLRLKVPSGYTSANSKIVDFNEDGSLKICGRPALLLEQCQPLGTEGDLIALAPDGIAAGMAANGIQQFMSIHVRFDYSEMAFKWLIRFDAHPFDLNPLTPYLGSTTTSSIVTLSSTRT